MPLLCDTVHVNPIAQAVTLEGQALSAAHLEELASKLQAHAEDIAGSPSAATELLSSWLAGPVSVLTSKRLPGKRARCATPGMPSGTPQPARTLECRAHGVPLTVGAARALRRETRLVLGCAFQSRRMSAVTHSAACGSHYLNPSCSFC